MADLPDADARNYIQCVTLIVGGKPVSKPQYQPDMAYACPRQAVGIKCGRIAWYASRDKLTPEQLRDRLTAYGWSDAVMLDGGGSTSRTASVRLRAPRSSAAATDGTAERKPIVAADPA